MSLSTTEALTQFIGAAIGTETLFEDQVRRFAEKARDDDEVRIEFVYLADASRKQRDQLKERLESLGVKSSSGEGVLGWLSKLAALTTIGGSQADVDNMEHLIAVYSSLAGQRAMYESLAQIANSAGDAEIESLARTIEAVKQGAAEKIWAFIPSRSKIAFNMMTVSEVDPAVETKIADSSVVES